MKRFFRAFILICTLSLVVCFFSVNSLAAVMSSDVTALPAEDEPFTTAESYILIDNITGNILAEKNSEQVMYPASTTKMMTAIVAIENADLDGKYTADPEITSEIGSKMYLQNGEICPIREVLYSTMIRSANDGAIFLAKATAGSVDAFIDLMNEKAQIIGCENTHFSNTNGLHYYNHYTTAADLAKIASYCMENPIFRDIVCRESYVMPATNLSDDREFTNTNTLLGKYDGLTGIKTGYTDEAGGCLVSAAERNGTSLLCVVLKSTEDDRFTDTKALLDWGFENYRTERLVTRLSPAGEVDIKRGAVRKLQTVVGDDVILTLSSEQKNEDFTFTLCPDELRAPIFMGDEIGTYVIYFGDETVAEIPLLAATDIKKGTFLSVFGIEDTVAYKIFKTVGVIFAVILILFIAFVTLMHIRAVNRRKLRRRRYRRMRNRQR